MTNFKNETWKPMPMLPGSHLVSSHGRIMQKNLKILKPTVFRGYTPVVRVMIKGVKYSSNLNREVAKAFLGLPLNETGYFVVHKDGNNQNNHKDNLEWVARSEAHTRYKN